MISYITGLSKDKVYEEIDAHKKNGGSMEDIFKEEGKRLAKRI